MSKKTASVDDLLKQAGSWREEFAALRSILLECGLEESVKWGQPCYSLENRNVVLIHGFKEYCALLFFKGALLKDAKGILVQQTENTQSARQIRFTSTSEITRAKSVLKSYVKEALELEKSGRKVEFKKTSEFAMPEEFRRRLDGDGTLKQAFEALTPGRQRAYLLHFSGAKQSSTRESRIDTCIPAILAGKGLNDPRRV